MSIISIVTTCVMITFKEEMPNAIKNIAKLVSIERNYLYIHECVLSTRLTGLTRWK